MFFDAELVPYCGGTYTVLKRVARIIDEKTGRMRELKNPCIILDSVFCQSRYSACRMFCPRGIYSWWREIWLERVEPAASGAANGEVQEPRQSQTCTGSSSRPENQAVYLDTSKSHRQQQ
jgi:hypothetical protein